jgi:polyisoprenoid-binding protein YceI
MSTANASNVSSNQSTPALAPGAFFTVDPVHTTAGFSVRHLMVTSVRGVFERLSGTVRYDATAPASLQVEATIWTASVRTRDAQRDAHLASADFFDSATHETMTFRSTHVTPSPDHAALVLRGDLTIRGVTRPVDLEVQNIAPEQRDFNGKVRIGAMATARIKRSEFGITFNKVLEAGGVAISDEVAITIDVSLVKEEAVA